MPVTELIAVIAVSAIMMLVPIGLIFVYYRLRVKRMDTIVGLTDAGSIDPELVKSLTQRGDYKADYRLGLIWLAIGLPLSLTIGFQYGYEHAVAGAIPIFIGIAFIVSGKLKLRGTES